MAIPDRFSKAFMVGRQTAWALKGTRTQVRKFGETSYRVLLANGAWMQKNGGSARAFRSLEKAMIAAIEHAGG